MDKVLADVRRFVLTHARLLERRLFQVRFEDAHPSCVGLVVRAYQNPDGGMGHALEPDIRCPESQPLFVAIGLAALAEATHRDAELAVSVCDYLESVSSGDGLVPFFTATAYQSPLAGHWQGATVVPSLNPTADICGLVHYQGVQHSWLSRATETCLNMITQEPPLEAHDLCAVRRLAEYMPDRQIARNLVDLIALALPKARFYIPDAPVRSYGLTPLHFAPRPDSILRDIFTQDQIDGHLSDLLSRQQEDGGWPIDWEAPGPASELEWRARGTLEAVSVLSACGVVG